LSWRVRAALFPTLEQERVCDDLTLENAMAAQVSIGLSMPIAASGMPTKL
jgi:hypothetical protein